MLLARWSRASDRIVHWGKGIRVGSVSPPISVYPAIRTQRLCARLAESPFGRWSRCIWKLTERKSSGCQTSSLSTTYLTTPDPSISAIPAEHQRHYRPHLPCSRLSAHWQRVSQVARVQRPTKELTSFHSVPTPWSPAARRCYQAQ